MHVLRRLCGPGRRVAGSGAGELEVEGRDIRVYVDRVVIKPVIITFSDFIVLYVMMLDVIKNNLVEEMWRAMKFWRLSNDRMRKLKSRIIRKLKGGFKAELGKKQQSYVPTWLKSNSAQTGVKDSLFSYNLAW